MRDPHEIRRDLQRCYRRADDLRDWLEAAALKFRQSGVRADPQDFTDRRRELRAVRRDIDALKTELVEAEGPSGPVAEAFRFREVAREKLTPATFAAILSEVADGS